MERFYRVVLVADKVAGRLRQDEQEKGEIKPAGDGCAAAVAQQAKQKLIFPWHCQSSLALQMATAVRDEIARGTRYTLVSDIPENQANSFVVDTIAVVTNGWGSPKRAP